MISRRQRQKQRSPPQGVGGGGLISPPGTHLNAIPEEQSIRFSIYGRRTSSSIDSSSQQQQNSQVLIFPGLLERDFEDEDLRLLNRSRVIRKRDPLRRSGSLDALAQRHAERMAKLQTVHHSVQTVEELQTRLRSQEVGENVQRGKSIAAIHKYIISKPDSFLFTNCMSEKYDEVGLGKVIGKKDGLVYWVQLYRSSMDEHEI